MSKLDDYGDNLGIKGQMVVFLIGVALVSLHKKLSEDPDNLSEEKILFYKEVIKAILYFKKESKKWIDTDLAAAYLLGVDYANKQNKINKQAVNDIINGTFLFKGIQSDVFDSKNVILKKYPKHIPIVNLIQSQALGYVNKQAFQILRAADDIFRQTAIEVSSYAYKEATNFTRLRLSQELLNEYSRKGLLTITYKNGAVHSIDNYCEMLGRTMTNNAFRQANLNRYQEFGYELGTVSSHFRACNLCTPYEGEILSLDGKSKDYPSIWDAETQGLFHPNCKHSISPYWEGAEKTKDVSIDPAEKALINEYGYKEAQKMSYSAQQYQRYNERQIRKYKRLTATSIDSRTKQRYNNKIREWQAKQRQLINNNPYLKRKYSREQIERAH